MEGILVLRELSRLSAYVGESDSHGAMSSRIVVI